MRSYIQISGVEYFETYAPVVKYSTICLALTMILSNNFHTNQVDYTNAFAQAYLKEEVNINPPSGFGLSDGISKVLRLIKSLYDVRQAPTTLFEKHSG